MNEHRGLCLCCQNSLTCTFFKNHNAAVLQCDEFDGFEPLLRKSKPFSNKTIRNLKSNPGGKSPDSYKGLCGNCEDRKTCTYPKLEGGVWHCEEYR
jgi:hypothetical protein